MLKVGEPAPPFDLPDSEMEMVSLASFLGAKNVVLYFYPKDDTPGAPSKRSTLVSWTMPSSL